MDLQARQERHDIISPTQIVCNGIYLNHVSELGAIELRKDDEMLFRTQSFTITDPVDRAALWWSPHSLDRVTLLPGAYECYWLGDRVVAVKPFRIVENPGG